MSAPKRLDRWQLAVFASGVVAAVALLILGFATSSGSSRINVAQLAPAATSTPAVSTPTSIPAPVSAPTAIPIPANPPSSASEPTATVEPTASAALTPTEQAQDPAIPTPTTPGFPTDAPSGDFFLPIGAPLGDDPAAQQRLSQRFTAMMEGAAPRPDIRIAEGSGTHIGTAQSERGPAELFLVDVQRGQGEPPIVDRGCLIVIAGFGDDLGCGNRLSGQDPIENDIQRGFSDEWVTVEVLNAQGGAAWLVIDTEDGTRLVAPVVSSTGYMLWSRRYGLYARVALFDAELEELWARQL